MASLRLPGLYPDHDSVTQRRKALACFTQAIEVSALDCHGPTMRLIGAFWATVAACCFENCGYEDQGRALLDQARVLSDAAPVIETLDAVLQAPDAARLGEVLGVLPFNYR